MTKTAKEILEQVYLFGMNGGLGYEKFDNELSPDQALKELEALIRNEKLKLLAEVRERVVGEDEDRNHRYNENWRLEVDAQNCLRLGQRKALTKLEAEQ